MIDTSKLLITLHKGAPLNSKKEVDLFVYLNHHDGTGILTDGQNFYFAYNDLKSVGDQCPPGARFMTANEALIIKRSKDILVKIDVYTNANPETTENLTWLEFKKEIGLENNT